MSGLVRTMSLCYLPIPVTAQVTTGNLKQTIWAIICNNFLVHTSWTSYLLAVFAVEKVLERVEAVV